MLPGAGETQGSDSCLQLLPAHPAPQLRSGAWGELGSQETIILFPEIV